MSNTCLVETFPENKIGVDVLREEQSNYSSVAVNQIVVLCSRNFGSQTENKSAPSREVVDFDHCYWLDEYL